MAYLYKLGCNMDHGYCTGEEADECLCQPGWKGERCDECIKYPGCPEEATCDHPWECNCPEGVEHEACNIKRKHNLLPQ